MAEPLSRVPDFVWRAPSREAFGVALLLFHRVEPAEFSARLGWLAENGYETLGADDLEAIALGRRRAPERAVALTFDDGLHNHWAVAAPLLRRHRMRGIAYVVPRLLAPGGLRPTLDDAEAGRVPLTTVLDDRTAGRWMTWEEAGRLSAEGVLDIQSHTFDHARVFTSDRIVDFQHPLPDGTPRYPWLWSACGAEPDEPLWGAPVYPTAPRLAGRRWHDDPGFRDACRRFAEIRGGRGWFADATWREEMLHFAALERRRHGPGRLESREETHLERLRTLVRAREELGERLGRSIDHVAVPWSRAAPDAPRLIRAAGYRTGATAERPSWRLRPGADPCDLGRVEGFWLESLPGPGRVSLARRAARRYFSFVRRKGPIASASSPVP